MSPPRRQRDIPDAFGAVIGTAPADSELSRAFDAWKHGGRYAAMGAALEVCAANPDRPLPAWLFGALSEFVGDMIHDASESSPRRAGMFRRWLRQRRADLIDAARVEILADALNHGLTWDRAKEMTAAYFSPTIARCTPDAVQLSYRRVLQRSKQAPGRYVMGPADRRWIANVLSPSRRHSDAVYRRFSRFAKTRD